MEFPEAVRSCLTKYVEFRGRASRSEYWWFALFVAIVDFVFRIIDNVIGNPILGSLVSLALLLPGLAVAARRLHDTDRSAWWLLLILVPVVGWIVLLVFYVLPSTGPNAHGPAGTAAPLAEPGYPTYGS